MQEGFIPLRRDCREAKTLSLLRPTRRKVLTQLRKVQITIREDADINRDYPGKFRCRVDITTRDGETRSAGVDYPHGHHLDPMTDAEVEAKFRELASRKLPREKVDAALAALWGFDKAANADGVFEIVAVA